MALGRTLTLCFIHFTNHFLCPYSFTPFVRRIFNFSWKPWEIIYSIRHKRDLGQNNLWNLIKSFREIVRPSRIESREKMLAGWESARGKVGHRARNYEHWVQPKATIIAERGLVGPRKTSKRNADRTKRQPYSNEAAIAVGKTFPSLFWRKTRQLANMENMVFSQLLNV